LPHTTRAALTGLRNKGYAIDGSATRAKGHSIGLSKSWRRRSEPDAMRARSSERRPMSQSATENLSAETDRIAALNIDELRALWRETMGRPAPGALSKDLIARALAYRLQEQSLGGLDPHFAVKARGRAGPPSEDRLGHCSRI
jgi:hypothetical protein